MMKDFPVNKIISELERDKLLPALLFRTSRRQCDEDIERLSRAGNLHIGATEQERLVREVSSIADKYALDESILRNGLQYEALVTTACGAHHAGQLFVWRLLIEELMGRGLLRLMIATGTVAAGVDFPARTVVITAHSKRGADGFSVLSSAEFQQMSGRAGRRGKDAVGICVVAPGPFSDARVVHEIAQRPAEPLRSVYFAAPATVLNLLKYRNVDDLRYTVERSFGSFLDRKNAQVMRDDALAEEQSVETQALTGEKAKKAQKRIRRKQREADELAGRQLQLLSQSLTGLESLGFVENGGLTAKGFWSANLCTTLVLELGEAIAGGLFDHLRIDELAGAVASIAGDPHRGYFNLKPNPLPKELYENLKKIVERVKLSGSHATSVDVAVLPDAALTVITWMESSSWAEFSALLRLAGVAEGDVARLVTQTADHLNQIVRLKDSHPQLAAGALEARKALLKPPLTDEILVA